MVNHPNRKNPILVIVSKVVGHRHKITRNEMRCILAELARHELIDLNNGWQKIREDADHAQAWADMCKNITVISVLANTDPVEARLASSNPGTIRYDEPGRMHPLMRATLIFAPASLERLEYNQIGQLRRIAKRVLIVDDSDI